MITLQNVTLQRGTKVLLENTSLSIFDKEKVGLVGINGCGKSSLFAMILGDLQPDSGDVFIQSSCRIAHLSQQIPHSTMSALDYVMRGDEELSMLLQKIKKAEEKKDHERQAKLHNKLYEIGGYAAEAKAAKLLNGLGFNKDEHNNAVNSFSGGWRMRLNLAKVLMCRSDLLLLDEPTNHLDLDAIVWLERFLQSYDGVLIVISHDREFLDSVVRKIVHVQQKKLDMYSGNYSDFEAIRAERIALQQKLYEKQQAKIAHTMQFVNRFKAKATKARQAQSRLKALQKMEKVAVTQIDSPFSFHFFDSKSCAPPLLTLEKIDFAYDDKPVFHDANFSLTPGDRIGLLGHNGAGKSTLMKLLGGQLAPNSGHYYRNKNLAIGYFAQHQVDQLDLNESPLWHFQQLAISAREQQIRQFLGGFNFSNDRVFESIQTFSGGEKARLVLAILVWQKPNLLLLDEPTNHLDLDMREALAYALQEYTGTLVLVSHDRYLLKSTVNEFYLVSDERVAKFSGDLSDYKKWLFDSRKEPVVVKKISKKRNVQQVDKIERKLEKLFEQKAMLEKKLVDPVMYEKDNADTLQDCMKQLQSIQQDIDSLEAEWLRQSN